MESHSHPSSASSLATNTLSEETITRFFQMLTDATLSVEAMPSAFAKTSVAKNVRASYIDYVKHILAVKQNAAFGRLCGNLILRISSLKPTHEFDAIITDINEAGKALQTLFAKADDTEKEDFIARLQSLTPQIVSKANNIPDHIESGQSKADSLSPFKVALNDYRSALTNVNQLIQEKNYQAAVIATKNSLTKIGMIYRDLSHKNQKLLLEDNIMFLAATLDIHADECFDKAHAENTQPAEREQLYEEAIQCKANALNFADFVHANGFIDALTVSQYAVSLSYALSELAKYYLEIKKDYEACINKYIECVQVLSSAVQNDKLPHIQKILAERKMQIASIQYLYSTELYNLNRINDAKVQLQKAIAYFEKTTTNITPLSNCKIGLVLAMRKSADESLENKDHKKSIDELNRASATLEELLKKLKHEKQIAQDKHNASHENQADQLMLEAKKQLALCQIHLAEIKAQYGSILIQAGKPEEALTHLESAIGIYEYFYPNESNTLPAAKKNLAEASTAISEKFRQQIVQFGDENKYQDAVDAAFEAFRMITPTICRKLLQQGQTVLLPNYALELIARLNKTAISYLEQASALPQKQEELWQQSIEHKGYALNLLCLLYQNQLLGDADMSQFQALANSAYAELRKLGEHYLFMSLTTENAANKLQEAIRKFQECRGLLETTPHDLLQNPAEKATESTHLLGLAWHRCGVVLLESDKFEDGISHLEVAIGILESIQALENELSTCQHDLTAARYRQKAQREKIMAEQLQTITQLKLSIAAIDNNLEKKASRLKYTIELAELQHQYAINRKSAGYIEGVIEQYKEAMTHFSYLLKEVDRAEIKTKAFACELSFAATLSSIAEAHYEAGRYKEALELYQQIMKTLFPYILNAKEDDTTKEINQCIVLLDTAKDMFRTAHHAYWKERNKPINPIKPGQFESALANIKRHEKFENLSKSLAYLSSSDIAMFSTTSKAAVLTVRNHLAKTEAQAKIKAKSTALANAIAASKAVAATHSHQKALNNFEIVLPVSSAVSDRDKINNISASKIFKK